MALTGNQQVLGLNAQGKVARLANSAKALLDGLVNGADSVNVSAGTFVKGARTLDVSLGQYTGGDFTFGANLTVNGNLTVQGTTTTVNSTTLQVADKLIVANKGGGNSAGGFEVDQATVGRKILWDFTNLRWKLGVGAKDDPNPATLTDFDDLEIKGLFVRGDIEPIGILKIGFSTPFDLIRSTSINTNTISAITVGSGKLGAIADRFQVFGTTVDTNTLVVNTAVASNLIPDANGTRNLGSATLRYGTGYFQNIDVANGILATTAERIQRSWTNGELTALAEGDVCYISGSDTMKKAQANALATAEAVAVAAGAIAASASGNFIHKGAAKVKVRLGAAETAIAVNTNLYLSDTEAGVLTTTAPSTVGTFVVPVAKCRVGVSGQVGGSLILVDAWVEANPHDVVEN